MTTLDGSVNFFKEMIQHLQDEKKEAKRKHDCDKLLERRLKCKMFDFYRVDCFLWDVFCLRFWIKFYPKVQLVWHVAYEWGKCPAWKISISAWFQEKAVWESTTNKKFRWKKTKSMLAGCWGCSKRLSSSVWNNQQTLISEEESNSDSENAHQTGAVWELFSFHRFQKVWKHFEVQKYFIFQKEMRPIGSWRPRSSWLCQPENLSDS